MLVTYILLNFYKHCVPCVDMSNADAGNYTMAKELIGAKDSVQQPNMCAMIGLLTSLRITLPLQSNFRNLLCNYFSRYIKIFWSRPAYPQHASALSKADILYYADGKYHTRILIIIFKHNFVHKRCLLNH